METNKTVVDIFESISKKMTLDFETSRNAFSHNGIKGENNEEILKDFLRNYLPKRLGLATGQVIDTTGKISKQLDIIIYDENVSPILKIGKNRIIPIEIVYAVIEVKSVINTSDIGAIVDNMLSVKKMQKKAYYTPDSIIKKTVKMYDMQWDIYPVHYYIFGFSSDNGFNLSKEINRITTERNLEVYERIDTGCILNKGIFINRHESYSNENFGKIDALSSNDTIFEFMPSRKSLLAFYLLIIHYLSQSELPYFRFKDYLDGIILE